MGDGTRRLTLEIVTDEKRAADGIDRIEGRLGRFSSFATSAAGGLAAGFAAAQVGQFATDALNLGSAVTEAGSKLDTLLGDLSAQPKEWAKTAAAIGLSEASALEAAGTFANLGTAIGLTQQQSADWSTELPTLAADLASFNNLDTDQAINAIGAALRGEAEPIRQFGVLLDANTLSSVAFANGIAEAGAQLTPAQKAQAAYLAIMEQTTAAQGDAVRTSDSWANQQRRLSAQWENFQTQLGKVALPLIEALATFVLEDLIPAFAAFGKWVSENWPKVWKAIEPVVTNIRNLITSTLEFLQGVWDRYGERVTAIIVTWAKAVASNIKNVIDVVAGVVEFVSAIFAGDWARAWEAALDVVRGILRFFGDLALNLGRLIRAQLGLIGQLGTDIARALANGIITAWNRLDISFSISIPSWVPGVGGRGWTVSDLIPDIPLLHSGGITTREGLAMLDAQEAVIPLDRFDRGGRSTQVNVYVDATLAQDPVAVGEAVRQALSEYDAVAGTSLAA